MNITLVIATLACGGAERVAATLANEWSARGESVSIVTFEDENTAPFYRLGTSVRLLNLGGGSPGNGLTNKLSFNLKKIFSLRKALYAIKPDALISFMGQTNVSAILAAAGTKIPVIITEHVDSRAYSPGKIWELMSRLLYPRAAALVAVSKGVFDSFPANIRKKGTVIYNPVAKGASPEAGRERHGSLIIGMGRLTGQKGFDLLLKAFGLVYKDNPAWNLEIWGEGEQRGELESLRDSLGLAGRVKFPGITDKPYDQFDRAGLFVLSSRFEGLGIVLCEAMFRGVPAVSFDCPSGPAEVIHDGIDGILVRPEDVEGLAKGMELLMKDGALRSRMAVHARETGRKFELANILPYWDALTAKILGSRDERH